MAWIDVCTVKVSGATYAFQIQSNALNNTGSYNGVKTDNPFKTSNTYFYHPSGALLEDGNTVYLFISARYGSNSSIRRIVGGTTTTASREMYTTFTKGSFTIEYESVIPFFNDFNAYVNWSRNYTYNYEKWIGGKFPSRNGRWTGLERVHGNGQTAELTYTVHDNDGTIKRWQTEEQFKKDIVLVDESKTNMIVAQNVPEKIIPISINFILLSGTTAKIHYWTYDVIWGADTKYTSITLYGKKGSEPACDNTDDIVKTFELELEVDNLDEESTYYFCIKSIDEDGKTYKSNVKKVTTSAVNRWKNVGTSNATTTTFLPAKLNDNDLLQNGNNYYFGYEGYANFEDNTGFDTYGTPLDIKTYIDIGKTLSPNTSCNVKVFENDKFNVQVGIHNNNSSPEFEGGLDLYYFVNDIQHGKLAYATASADYHEETYINAKLYMLFVENKNWEDTDTKFGCSVFNMTYDEGEEPSNYSWENYSCMPPDESFKTMYNYFNGI